MTQFISKPLFVQTLKNIKEQSQKIDEFNGALETLCDGYVVFDANNRYLESLLDVLREVFNDEEDYIGWWLYEEVEKVIWIDNQKLDVSNPGVFYDFLTDAEELYDFLVEI